MTGELSLDSKDLLSSHRHLLACLSMKDGNSGPSGMDGLDAETWQRLVRRSLEHSVAPILYDRLQGSGVYKKVPVQVWERLRRIYLTGMSRNLRLYSRLAGVLTRFAAEDIPVIVLKGAHLAQNVYGDVALRTFDDVDLLFRGKDLPRCRAILNEKAGRKLFEDLLIDIQWNIDLSMADLPIRAEGLWRRSRPATIGGAATRVLCPEDLLLHVCLHVAFHHRFQSMGIRALCDIRQTIIRFGSELNWQALTDRAVQWRAGNAVGLTLSLADGLLDANVPADALHRLNPAGLDPGPVQWAIRQIFSPSQATSNLSPFFWGIVRPGTLGRKLVYLRRLMMPDRQHMIQKYGDLNNSKKLNLFYGKRLIAHLGRYVKAISALRKKDRAMVQEAGREIEHGDMLEWLVGH